MLQGIRMNIVDMALIVGLFTDEMLSIMRCHTPRSPADLRTFERRSVLGKARENPLLIRRHRMLKLLSPGDKVHTLGNCSCVALPPASMQSNANVPAKRSKRRFETGGDRRPISLLHATNRSRE